MADDSSQAKKQAKACHAARRLLEIGDKYGSLLPPTSDPSYKAFKMLLCRLRKRKDDVSPDLRASLDQVCRSVHPGQLNMV